MMKSFLDSYFKSIYTSIEHYYFIGAYDIFRNKTQDKKRGIFSLELLVMSY